MTVLFLNLYKSFGKMYDEGASEEQKNSKSNYIQNGNEGVRHES